ncbi:hypothetical protein GGD56_000408 [Rhizobium mongolense]|uniref:Uncharacterized protein n=2 Tax=Rhizobium mongolense TaxID=57676 RepID=A0ABR6IFE9_9HYPH|nr:hypothetical protein [Rhizobium mongolense]TVZ73844.1 hypothetical protein BCL32_2115 [Rhizobium mongolense USDA 1844]
MTLVIVVVTCTFFGVAASLYLRSYNEVSESDDQWAVQTRIGDFRSLRKMGGLPLPLIWTIKTRPDRLSCVISTDDEVLRWEDFSGSLLINVCLTRVLARSTSVSAAIDILKKNGFEQLAQRTQPNFPPAITEMAAFCPSHAEPCSKSFGRLGGWFGKPHALSVSLIYHGSELLDVNAVPLTK